MSLLKYYIVLEDENADEKYQNLLEAGTNDSSLEIAEENLKRFFPDVSLEDVLPLLQTNQVFEDMLQMVRNAFIKWYNWDPGKIIINQKNQDSIISYAVTEADYPMFIHIGALLDSTIFSFMTVMLKWAKFAENNLSEQGCFNQLLYIINEMALMGLLPADSGKRAVLEDIIDDVQLQNLASDCYWAMLLFTAGHEMAHIYQMSTNPNYWLNHRSEAESNADYIGYDILLHLIMEPGGTVLTMEEYTYLAPMMFMDMFELIFFTDKLLYRTISTPGYHGTSEERKKKLFCQVDEEKYQFDTELGNSVYQSFQDSYDKYCDLLQKYQADHRIDKIKHLKERKERRHL